MESSRFSKLKDEDFWTNFFGIIAVLYIIASFVFAIFIMVSRGFWDGLILLVALVVGVPFALFMLSGFFIFFIYVIYSGYSYLRRNKDRFALHWILLCFFALFIGGYWGFSMLTDSFFFRYGSIYYPYEETGYYHGDENCYYLDVEDFDPDYCRHMLLKAQINGYQPCENCIDKDKEYGSRYISVISYIIFFAIVIALCEYRARKEEKRF